nr:hemopexin repeat-containing protein [Streptomyces peucetius]
MIPLWEADQSTSEWYDALTKALRDVVDGLRSFALFVGLFPQLSLLSHLYDALGFLAAFWEKFRNDDDLVLTRGLAFGTPALSAIYDSPNRGTSWTFDASSEGMGRFELHVRYTGEEPVLPVGESKLLSGRPMLSGAGFDVGLDAVCNVPGSTSDLYFFKGQSYLRYDASAGKITRGPENIGAHWPDLDGTSFALNINAACQVPGSSTDVHLFNGLYYIRYNPSAGKAVSPPTLIAFGWAGLLQTVFIQGVDAACPVPGSSTDVYLFKGDQCVRYNFYTRKIVVGPVSIGENWPSLVGTLFAYSLDAASAVVPGSSDTVYMFKRNRVYAHTL